jgi:hypothetical protein
MAHSISYLSLLVFGGIAGALVGAEVDGDSLAYAAAAISILIGLGPFIIE